MRTEYLTIRNETRHEIEKLKGSRFLGCTRPVTDEQQARDYLADLRAEYHDARHHCSAWRIAPNGDPWRYSDDGEPSGSAGRPILQQMEGADVSGLVVVVVRWFGGTKLGVGGLMRAYGAAAKAVIEVAGAHRVILTERVVLRYPYDCEGAVQGLLSASGQSPVASEYGASIELCFDVPLPDTDEFVAAFVDRTAGRGEASVDRPRS